MQKNSKEEKEIEKMRIKNVFRLTKRLKPYAIRLTGAVISGVGHQISMVGISAFCAHLVGIAFTGELLGNMTELAVILGIIVAARVFFYFAEMWLAHDVAFKVLADFRIQLYEAIERVSPALLLNMRSGQLAATLMGDVELLEWFFAHTFGSILVAIIAPALLLVYLGKIDLLLPGVMLVFLAVILWIPFWRKKKADMQGKKVREQLGDVNAVTMEGIQGMKEILSLNYLDEYQKKHKTYMSRFYSSQLDYGKRLGTEGALLQGVLGIGMLCTTAVAARLVQKGIISQSLYPVVVMMAGMVLGPVVEVCNTARNFGLIFASADRVYRVLEMKALVADSGKEQDIENLNPIVSYESVSFRYQKELENAVENVSFTAEPGEIAALVGFSGAGKSTCMNLLMRCWDVEEGIIRIGGMDIREMSLKNLRELTSAVLQDVYLFRDTIRENIRLGKPSATNEEVEQAAKMAHAHEFIVELPKGYDTIAGESGIKLSGGQRQRVALARAFLKNSPILILDEAVSNLDTENEKEIQEAIKVLGRKRTTLIVAHRLSTIRLADKIVVLKDGKVEQIGTFEKLSRQNGFFRELISSQYDSIETEGRESICGNI